MKGKKYEAITKEVGTHTTILIYFVLIYVKSQLGAKRDLYN